LMGCRFIKW